MVSYMQHLIISLISDISEFYKISGEEDKIVLNKFHTEKDIIKNLDLQAFPVTIKYCDIPQVQTSIIKVTHFYLIFINVFYIVIKIVIFFQIIERTGVSVWNHKILSEKVLNIMMISVPNVKFIALNLCIKLMKFSLLSKQASILCSKLRYIYINNLELNILRNMKI